MSKPKTTPAQREAVLATVAELAAKGWTQPRIADEIEKRHGVRIGQPQVSRYWSKCVAKYREQVLGDVGELLAGHLAKVSALEAELWREWDCTAPLEETTLAPLMTLKERREKRARVGFGEEAEAPPAAEAAQEPQELQELLITRQKLTARRRDPRIALALAMVLRHRAEVLGLTGRGPLGERVPAEPEAPATPAPLGADEARAFLDRHLSSGLSSLDGGKLFRFPNKKAG